ncbi:MAG: hypothetical protein EXQ67_06125 [Thermoleophilia bacterium]|nr:hypothetical protein [Thermoleophilia bacterium]
MDPQERHCTACGAAVASTTDPTASAQPTRAVPNPAVDTPEPVRVPVSAPNDNHVNKSWIKRHKGLAITIAVVGFAPIGVISNRSNNDTPQSGGTADGVAAFASCSPETLQDLVSEYIDLGNSTYSAYLAIPDVLTPAAGSTRLKIRFARESAQQQKIYYCVNVSDSTADTELLVAITALQDANSILYTYYESYLDTKTGTIKGINQRADAVSTAIERFNAAWAAYGEEQGFEIDQTDDPTIDESKVAD